MGLRNFLFVIATLYHGNFMAFAKGIYLNGVDISSTLNQEMKGVDVRIDEHGQIFITAPHYQVIEEDSFQPLGLETPKEVMPDHKAPQPISKEEVPPKGKPEVSSPKVEVPADSGQSAAPSVPAQQKPAANAL